MKEYYILLRLNRKEYEIMNLKKENGKIEVELKSKKKKVRWVLPQVMVERQISKRRNPLFKLSLKY